MGKRRDRRHAVLGGGGRRMKLDLRNDDEVAALEDMSIGTTVEEGGEKTGVESDERLSPHSLQGPVQVNPLSLLGQYSDEDEDEEEEEKQLLANGSSGGVRAVSVSGQVDEKVATFLADLETSGLLNDEDGAETEAGKQAKNPQEADTKEKEILCEWEAVLHKETSEYYYWNKVTGDTTWEKPAAFASYESEILKRANIQDRFEEGNEHALEDPLSRSNSAHEASTQKAVSTISNADVQEAKNTASDDRNMVDSVENGQSKDFEPEAMSLEQAGKQDDGSDSDDGKQSVTDVEITESPEMIDHTSGNAEMSDVEIRGDPDATSSAAATEHGTGESCQVDASMTLNTVENDEVAEDLAVEPSTSGGTEDHPATVDRADAADLENADERDVPEQPKKYDHHRMLERGEVLVEKFKMLAGEALRSLSSKLRLAVESDVRLSDCKAMAMHDFVEDGFWEHMDSQISRLEDLLVAEQAVATFEAQQQILTSSVAEDDHQNKHEADVNRDQGSRHQPAGVPERIFKSTPLLRSEDEDMDVDMDLDMETEDEKIVGTSAAARSADHEATVPLPQPGSYGYTEPQPLIQALPTLSESPLFPVASLFPSVVPIFPVIQTSFPSPTTDSWVPPPPPEEEWAPPPLPDQEAPPPPPPDEDEPLLAPVPDSNTLDPSYISPSAPVGSSSIYYSVGTNQSSHEISDVNSSQYGVVDMDTGSVHTNGNVVPPSVASTGAADASTKKSSKVRSKKRSHSTAVGASLMSNKKVSSLVNKWMAAQEELHSSDEEEEDKDLFDVEALEKKRQKDIEEWRHQTLASGGALENANFQPLGTLDWRERVKRAKREAIKLAAKQEKEAKQKQEDESKKDPTHASDEPNLEADKAVASTTPPKRPDLKELAKDLPSGWQAFWDAESCEVYYGNLATSETSWDRPV